MSLTHILVPRSPGNAYILKLYDFYPTWPFTLGWYACVYSVFQFVVFAAVIKAFPGMFGGKTNKSKLRHKTGK